jgi:ABC-type transport system substrate-binding protein
MSVGYWKIDLERTRTNIYGESSEKWYWEPVIVPCNITRGEITVIENEFGIDTKQTITLTVPITTFQNLGFAPEVGDIVGDADKYYEVDNISEEFFTIVGTGTTNNTSTTPGQYITFQISAHLTRISKLNLLPFRL